MSEEAKTVNLIAVERGFRNGRMVEPGTRFSFNQIGDDGKQRKLPKWAVKDVDFVPVKQKQKAGDLRPKDAQAASKAKAGELSGEIS